MAKTFIADLQVGETINTIAVIRKLELRDAQTGKYLLLELGDRSGRIKATLWNNAQEISQSLKVGDISKVTGSVISYKEMRQIKIDGIRKAIEGESNLQDLFQGPRREIQDLERELDLYISEIKTPFLKALVESLISTKGKFRKQFMAAPGGKLWHHNYRAGLLEHTVSVTRICREAAGIYPLTDHPLLIAGALLHDLGKVIEYDYSTHVIDFSDKGRLKGHIVIGYELIMKEVESIANFPEEFIDKLGHMILSHQGQREFGSPVVPATLEALLLYYADEMDSKATAFSRILDETIRQGNAWSKFVPLMDRFLFAGGDNMASDSL